MAEPPPPDPQDWTWVLQRRCPQCGLDVSRLSTGEVADRAEAAVAEWVQVLTSHPWVAQRPEPNVWSPLEYGAHVRDVVEVFAARLARMLATDDPIFDAWDQDRAAVAGAYGTQDPDDVADALAERTLALLELVRRLPADQLDRPGRRGDGARFTVTTLLRYLLHDLGHHLWDVTGQQGM